MTTKHGRSVTRNCGQTAEAAVTDDDRTAGFRVIKVRHAEDACSDDNRGVVRHRSRNHIDDASGRKAGPSGKGRCGASKSQECEKSETFCFHRYSLWLLVEGEPKDKVPISTGSRHLLLDLSPMPSPRRPARPRGFARPETDRGARGTSDGGKIHWRGREITEDNASASR